MVGGLVLYSTIRYVPSNGATGEKGVEGFFLLSRIMGALGLIFAVLDRWMGKVRAHQL
jgi:hypothetical protein